MMETALDFVPEVKRWKNDRQNNNDHKGIKEYMRGYAK